MTDIETLRRAEIRAQRKLDDAIALVKEAARCKEFAFEQWMKANQAYLRATLEAEMKAQQ